MSNAELRLKKEEVGEMYHVPRTKYIRLLKPLELVVKALQNSISLPSSFLISG